MIELSDQVHVNVPTLGFDEATYLFPSFLEMAPLIEAHINAQGKDGEDLVQALERSRQERLRMFDAACIGTKGLPARSPVDAAIVDLCHLEGWQRRIPDQVKIAATSPFSALDGVRILGSEAFGDPTVVEIDALVGTVTFQFPSIDDAAFAAALKALMTDRIRRRNRHIVSRIAENRRAFLRAALKGTQGALHCEQPPTLDVLPANWLASVCTVFERAEALGETDRGN